MNVIRSVMGAMLDPGAVYQAPSGRLCTLAPGQIGTPTAAQALLLYCDGAGHQGAKSVEDGFTLSSTNWYLLRRVG